MTLYKINLKGIPEVYLRHSSDLSLVSVLEDNQNLADRLADKSLPDITVTSFPVGEDGFMAPVKIYTPKGLDVTKKHPMILYIYGGPGAQQVASR